MSSASINCNIYCPNSMYYYKYVCDKCYRRVVAITSLPLLPKLVPSYCPGEEQFIEVGVKAALRDVLHKGVLLYVFRYTTQFGCIYYLPVHMYMQFHGTPV